MRGQSGGEDFELLGQGRVRIEGVPRLSLAHHVDHSAAAYDEGHIPGSVSWNAYTDLRCPC